MPFTFHHIKTTGTFQPVYQQISKDDDALLGSAKRWGAFFGLFGLGSDEFFLVCTGENSNVHSTLSNLDDVSAVRTIELEPTARPTNDSPVKRDGLYVFRFFGVENKNVDRIAQLSADAWKYFEKSDQYQAVPQALFCESNRSTEQGLMLLVTWYDGLNSWQISRQPPEEARANFRERATLTHYTKPFATRLLK